MNRIIKRSIDESKSFIRKQRFFRILKKDYIISLKENEYFKNLEND